MSQLIIVEKDFKINSPPPITSVIENLIPKINLNSSDLEKAS